MAQRREPKGSGSPYPTAITLARALLERAGLPDMRFRDLRHSFATLTLAKGTNVNTVSRMLGHSSVKATLDVYAHLMPGMQEEALEALDGLF